MTLPVVAAEGAAEVEGASTAARSTAGASTKDLNKKQAKAPAKAQSEVKNRAVKGAKKTGKALGGIGKGGSDVHYRQLLAAEIVIGSLIILTQSTDQNFKGNAHSILKQEAAFLVVFFFLAALGGAGKSSGRFAATLGGVICLTLLLRTPDNLFTRFAGQFSANSDNIAPIDQAAQDTILANADSFDTGGSLTAHTPLTNTNSASANKEV